jgi:hypothetical protein
MRVLLLSPVCKPPAREKPGKQFEAIHINAVLKEIENVMPLDEESLHMCLKERSKVGNDLRNAK